MKLNICFRFSSRLNSLLGGFATYSRLKGSNDDDWADRCNHLYTVLLLALFSIFVSTGQYVGDPIQCWCPAEFTSAFVAYTKYYCWISNTYYIPMRDVIPSEIHWRESKEINYYQWVPIILLFMALMFKIPCIIWRVFNGASGVSLEKIVDLTATTQIGSPVTRDQTIHHIAIYMDRWLETHREYHWNVIVRIRQKIAKFCCFFCGKREGTYLTGFYLFIKMLYVVNVFSQFFILNAFLGHNFYSMFGFEVVENLAKNYEWRESHRFPRVTLCDFQIRQLQNIHRYTVQCVLPINLFNEKIFIFIWFWLVLISAATSGNFLFWIYRVVFRQNRLKYIKKYLKITNNIHTIADKKLARRFADQYLRDDGIFVLRLVSKNSNDMVLSDLVQELWRIFRNKPHIIKDLPEETGRPSI